MTGFNRGAGFEAHTLRHATAEHREGPGHPYDREITRINRVMTVVGAG